MKGRSPTKEEREWMNSAAEFGCVVCHIDLGVFSPAAIHHLSGKTKPGAHLLSFGLCPRHHQIPGPGYVSRHGDGKARFEARYGSESELLEFVRAKLL